MARNIEISSFDSLKNKWVLITGATGGIGQAIARAFDKVGANLIITGRNEEKLSKLASELQSKTLVKTCDISNTESINTFCDEIIKDVKVVDVAILNAGITDDNLLFRMSEDSFENVINTNLRSAFTFVKKLARPMMKSKFGRFISIASVVGRAGNPGQANYVSSKSGLIGLMKTVSLEFAKKGITANTIAPGFIETEMTAKLTEDQQKAITATIPLDCYGKPGDIANGCVFLASDMASYITGHCLDINGGMYRN